MAELNELTPSDVSTPPPFEGPEERCAAIPWEIRRHNVYGSFWRTVLMVLAHPSRLGELIDQPVNPKQAKEFRRMSVQFFVLGWIGAVMAAIASAPRFKEQNEGVGAAICIGIPLGLAFSWPFARFIIGASRWFFYPPQLTPRQQETSLSLSYYLTAPLALAAVACLSLPLLAIDHPLARMASRLLCSIPPLAAMAWYYVLVVVGLYRIARRQDLNLAFSAIGMALVWAAIWAGMILTPVCVAMWLLMYGSLT